MHIQISDTRPELGRSAAVHAAALLRGVLQTKPSARVVFAAAPSQSEFLAHLATQDVDWSRVEALHMDEYIGLARDHPAGFGNWLQGAFFSRVPVRPVFMADQPGDAATQATAYAAILAGAPVDLVCCGIGVNGHLAFNDPPTADFDDPMTVKVVDLDAVCRQQQVDDGCFPTLADVPLQAITLTIPALVAAPHVVCVVPGAAKAPAVARAVTGEVTTDCPASILQRHPDCALFLDLESAAGLGHE